MIYNHPQIKDIYPVYRVTDEVFRVGAQIGITKEFHDPQNKLWELANTLDGRPLEDVLKKMYKKFPHLEKEDIMYGIEMLDKEELIEEVLIGEEKNILERYKPNVNYFGRYMNSDGNKFEVQKKLNSSTILLLGLGGGGSNILSLLAGVGAKKIIIVDYDVVEEGNLGRQLLYRESDIGKLKTEVATKAIQDMNSNIIIEAHNEKITSPEDVLKFTKGVDLVISAIDEPQFVAFRNVNEAIVRAKIPCVFSASQVSRGRVFTIIPNVSRCFDCLNIRYTLGDSNFVNQFIGINEVDFEPPTVAYAPAIFQLTAAVVDEAVRVLTGYAPVRTANAQLEINYEDSSSFMHKPYERCEDDCPTCGNGKKDDWEVFKYYGK